jgi:hypothetical protein
MQLAWCGLSFCILLIRAAPRSGSAVSKIGDHCLMTRD